MAPVMLASYDACIRQQPVRRAMNRSNESKYMVVVAQGEDGPRALLFDDQGNYLADVDEQSVPVEDLVKAALPCSIPLRIASSLERWTRPRFEAAKMRCFAVG